MAQRASPGVAAIVVMGVSGAGKSTVGQLLAARLDCPFRDADSFHPPANIAKMSSGAPLTDEDRWPWLRRDRGLDRRAPRGRHDLRGDLLGAQACLSRHRDRRSSAPTCGSSISRATST